MCLGTYFHLEKKSIKNVRIYDKHERKFKYQMIRISSDDQALKGEHGPILGPHKCHMSLGACRMCDNQAT